MLNCSINFDVSHWPKYSTLMVLNRSVAQIKADTGKLGDLGLVAEQSRGGQRTMFQPALAQATVQTPLHQEYPPEINFNRQ